MGWLLKKDFQSRKIESWEEMVPSLQLDHVMSAWDARNYGSYLVTEGQDHQVEDDSEQ